MTFFMLGSLEQFKHIQVKTTEIRGQKFKTSEGRGREEARIVLQVPVCPRSPVTDCQPCPRADRRVPWFCVLRKGLTHYVVLAGLGLTELCLPCPPQRWD